LSPYVDQYGEAVLKVWKKPDESSYRFEYIDGAIFEIDKCGIEIVSTSGAQLSPSDLYPYLVGSILGFVLRLRDILALHASCVSIDEDAVALTGPCGIGKSTLAAAFARDGRAVLSDDIVALTTQGSGGFLAHSGYPRLNLWPRSVEMLFGKAETLPLISTDSEKRFLQLGGGFQFAVGGSPLRAIYVVEDDHESARPSRIETLSKRDALLKLVANTYANHLLNAPQRRQEFEVLTSLASSVPVRRLRVRHDGQNPSSICNEIANDYENIRSC
jgi:hypothetical protein